MPLSSNHIVKPSSSNLNQNVRHRKNFRHIDITLINFRQLFEQVLLLSINAFRLSILQEDFESSI